MVQTRGQNATDTQLTLLSTKILSYSPCPALHMTQAYIYPSNFSAGFQHTLHSHHIQFFDRFCSTFSLLYLSKYKYISNTCIMTFPYRILILTPDGDITSHGPFCFKLGGDSDEVQTSPAKPSKPNKHLFHYNTKEVEPQR